MRRSQPRANTPKVFERRIPRNSHLPTATNRKKKKNHIRLASQRAGLPQKATLSCADPITEICMAKYQKLTGLILPLNLKYIPRHTILLISLGAQRSKYLSNLSRDAT